jgi:predicted acylesterase/phospholipase RssA
LTGGIPALFRTYRAPKNNTFNCTIWEAARATSAAPTIFKNIVIGGPGSQQPYIDGGTGLNNPTMQVLEEAGLIFPNRHVACVVSIGTGQAKTIGIPKPGLFQQVVPIDVVKAMIAMANDCESVSQAVARRFPNTPNFYFRFNVEQGMQDVMPAQWDRLDRVTAHTQQYLMTQEVDQRIGVTANTMLDCWGILTTAQLGNGIQNCLRQAVSFLFLL